MCKILAEKIKVELEMKEKLVTKSRERSNDDVRNVMSTKELHFDPPIVIQLSDSENPTKISVVHLGEALIEPDFGDCSYEASADGVDLLVTVVRFEGSFYHTTHGRRKLYATCKKIQELAKTRYSPLYCRVLGAVIVEVGERSSDLWVATEGHGGIVTRRLLECSGSFSLSKAISYLESILNALSDLHSCNIAHQDLSLSNMVVSTSTAGLQLINPGITKLLKDLHQTHPISSRFEITEEILWRPPEIISRAGQVGKKADIWNAGYVFLQMCLGLSWPGNFEGPEDARAALRLPEVVRDLLADILQNDAYARPSSTEILNHPAFAPKSLAEYALFGSTNVPSSSPQSRSYTSFMDTPKRQERSELSRYKTDFEEIQFLGKGAFGEVIKVRNRIDNRYYAIKRIRLDPSNVEYNKKILREVVTLSRLHHDRVVRYYQAWIEGGQATSGLHGSIDSASGADDDDDYSGYSNNSGSGSGSGSEDNDEEWTREGVSSRKMYSSNMISSSTSLSSLIQFHTGFTSEEPSSSDRQRHDHGKELGLKRNEPQYLYIQMEYCPNQTLRDVIDTGMDREECWRLFRQVIEGLCHLHAQGMIHRDLKPGNIFLDTNGDVKIGDFGLAVGDEGEPVGRSSPTPVKDDIGESLTGGIGTPLYVSPEQEKDGSRYNQKVDMYSLGIILLELLVPFSTGMERAMVIKDARSPSIKLPNNFDRPEMSKATAILKNLLCHNPKSRFSTEELLRSDLLPPKVEDEYINEAIRTVSTPNTPYFDKLLTGIFSQPPDHLRDYTFDFHSGLVSDVSVLSELDEVCMSLAAVSRRHGAIEYDAPLFLPNGVNVDASGPTMLMKSGQIVHLPTGLTKPFARFVAQHGINDMRRYSTSSVFHENVTGGQPRQSLEATFDIIYSGDDLLVPELEAICVAGEALNNIAGTSLSFVLRLNHLDVLGAVLTQCQVPSTKKKMVMQVLSLYHNTNWNKVKSVLASQVVLPTSCIDAVGKLTGIKDIEPSLAIKRLEELLRSAKDCHEALKHLSLMVTSLSFIGLKFRICIDPLFNIGDDIYSGTVFQLSQEERKRTGSLANGGAYKELLDSYRLPTDRKRNVHSIGVIWQASRLLNLRAMHGTRPRRDTKVLVYSSGPDLLGEKLEIASILWDAGIMADIIREDVVASDYINQVVRSRGISLAVQLKDYGSRGQFGLVRLRNFDTRQEVDITRPEIVEAIRESFADTDKEPNLRGDLEGAQGSHPTFAPLNVSLFAPYAKVKGSQKSFVMEKAVRAMAPVLASFSGPKPIEVIAHDLSLELARRIIDRLSDTDDAFRKCIDSRDEREAAMKMRTLLRGLRDKKSFAFLYNYREGWIELACLAYEGQH